MSKNVHQYDAKFFDSTCNQVWVDKMVCTREGARLKAKQMMCTNNWSFCTLVDEKSRPDCLFNFHPYQFA